MMNPGQVKQVLLVDDEEIILASVKHALLKMGYGVVAVQSGAQAFEVFSREPSLFSLVITDQTMPRMTGTQLAEKIARVRSDIPIILCTGMNNAADPETKEAAGIRELLTKPASLRELRRVVTSVLETRPELTVV